MLRRLTTTVRATDISTTGFVIASTAGLVAADKGHLVLWGRVVSRGKVLRRFGLLLLVVLAATTQTGTIFDAPWSEPTAHVYAAGPEPADQVYNVRSSRFGARGDGVADDWAAIQDAINIAPNSSTIYLPTGAYRITATLDFGSKVLRLQGDSQGRAAEGVTSGGSVIFGSVNGPLLKTGTALNAGIIIERLGFRNTHATGTGLTVTGVGIALRDLGIQAFIGIDARLNTFTLLIENVVIHPITAFARGSIGILASSHTQIIGCDIVTFDHGIRAYGTTVNITGCRLEVNNTAMMLGMDETGATHVLARSYITGNSMEANDTGIQVRSIQSTFLGAMAINGSVNAPSRQSKLGLYVEAGSWSEFNSITVTGSFSTAGVRVKAGIYRFRNVLASNTFAGAQAWDIQTNLVNLGFDGCNYTQRPDDVTTGSWIDYQRGVVTHTLRQIDNLNPGVEGKNLRGRDNAVTQTATTLAVTFTAGGHNTGSSRINTAAAAAGGSLAPNTYYYVASAVTAHGETGITSEKSVVVGGGKGTVDLTFFAQTADGFKRRIYRGTVTGVYDGYFETALNSNATFSDTGQAFTGFKSPPGAQDTEVDMREPDANYAVIVTPNWGTTAWVTAKATTGFTINFGTAAPAGATVDWFIVR